MRPLPLGAAGRPVPSGLGATGVGLPARLPAPPASGLLARPPLLLPDGVDDLLPFFGAGLVAR